MSKEQLEEISPQTAIENFEKKKKLILGQSQFLKRENFQLNIQERLEYAKALYLVGKYGKAGSIAKGIEKLYDSHAFILNIDETKQSTYLDCIKLQYVVALARNKGRQVSLVESKLIPLNLDANQAEMDLFGEYDSVLNHQSDINFHYDSFQFDLELYEKWLIIYTIVGCSALIAFLFLFIKIDMTIYAIVFAGVFFGAMKLLIPSLREDKSK